MSTTLTVSDLHFPFHHEHAIDFIADLDQRLKPTEVVVLGDEIDSHGWSRHDRNPELPGESDETSQAALFMRSLYAIWRGSRRVRRVRVCRSNHSYRALKQASRQGIPAAWVREPKEVLAAPKNWDWADYWEIEGVLFQHGEGYGGKNAALDAALANRQSTVMGHVHSFAGVAYQANNTSMIWGMNAGCLVNPKSLAFEYAKWDRNKQCLGTGVVEDGIPHFIPL